MESRSPREKHLASPTSNTRYESRSPDPRSGSPVHLGKPTQVHPGELESSQEDDALKLTTLKPRLSQLVTQRIPVLETERLRGRAAVARRAAWLRLHPLCVECEKEGRVTAGDVVDHRVPLWKGGADHESNFQTLCQKPHHDEKSKREAAERASGGRA